MIEQLKTLYQRIFKQYTGIHVDYYTGVTGGTNLMVLAAGIVGIQYSMTLHYVLNPEFLTSPENADLPLIIEIEPSELNHVFGSGI